MSKQDEVRENVKPELCEEGVDAPPPILGTWSWFYAVIILNTLVVYFMLLLFSVLTR